MDFLSIVGVVVMLAVMGGCLTAKVMGSRDSFA